MGEDSVRATRPHPSEQQDRHAECASCQRKCEKSGFRIRINRLRLGNFGDCKTIQGIVGLYELRIHIGAGYRLYFGKAKDHLVIVLCGGDKRSQERDIEKAKEYWRFYKESLRKR
jgi:putative addiction module killer protein